MTGANRSLRPSDPAIPETVRSPLQGTVVDLPLHPGDAVDAGQVVAVIESMKMEHVVTSPLSGVVRRLAVEASAVVQPGDPLVVIDRQHPPVGAQAGPPDGQRARPGVSDADVVVDDAVATAAPRDADTAERPELAEVLARRRLLLDDARPDAVARRHQRGRATARELVTWLCDDGSFTEYGGLAIAAQRARRPLDELVTRTPADGVIAGIGRVNGDHLPDERARCAVVSYDYTVLAGTQGQLGHRKQDRLFELVDRLRLPVVLFAEGGGGRPGDTDNAVVTGLDCMAFALFGRLSGHVPLVGIASGRCFAGNAALLACCDVVIATEGSSIGMGGPAMIEGGGLGTFHPDDVGPVDVLAPVGAVDLVAADDAHAVRLARQYLGYFQGARPDWEAPDERSLRNAVPERRNRAYDVRTVIDGLADVGSVLELRGAFAPGMVTALVRIEGRPLGVVANNPLHLGGAIDRDGADKAARFLQLCDAHGLPVLSLCDTPGFMVGPEAEAGGQLRHFGRLFVVGGSLRVPVITVVLRKGYGLGAQAMAAGSFHATLSTVAWPTAELGGMGLEGAVRLGFRRELEAAADDARQALFDQLVATAYEHGKALNVASVFEIDDVIDPADTRHHVTELLRALPPHEDQPERPCVDTW
jgi:acetyl-CoA carboxylase carboxyltransferase component